MIRLASTLWVITGLVVSFTLGVAVHPEIVSGNGGCELITNNQNFNGQCNYFYDWARIENGR